MQTVQFRQKVGADGVLRLEVPDLPHDQEIEAVVVVQSQNGHSLPAPNSSNWVDESYGCCADDPIERPEQGDWPAREEVA